MLLIFLGDSFKLEYLGCKGSWVQIPPRRPFSPVKTNRLYKDVQKYARLTQVCKYAYLCTALCKSPVEKVWNAFFSYSSKALT